MKQFTIPRKTRRRRHRHTKSRRVYPANTRRNHRSIPPEGRVLLTHQLFPRSRVPEPASRVVVADHMWLTDEKPFNKLTLLHRFITSSQYATEHGYYRCWIGDHPRGPFTAACRLLKKQGCRVIKMFDPVDQPLVRSIKRICKRQRLRLILEDSPSFSETHKDLDTFLKKHPPTTRKTPNGKQTVRGYNHDSFYKWNRTRLGLLMTSGGKKPLGSKWTYDTENREPFPKTLKDDPTTLVSFKTGSTSGSGLSRKFINEEIPRILRIIEKRYGTNPGVLDTDNPADAVSRASRYPLTRATALKRLDTFFKDMLPKFGPYEDAFRHTGVPYGYHSVLSSSLNNGLLTPEDVIGKIREVSGKLPRKFLPSLEGFTRQVFGWRAYTHMVYREERDTLVKSNYLGHTKRLGKGWFRGEAPPTTGIDWLDTLFRDATERAYAHHIVRLMVFSQWFLLMRIRPLDVLDWFWSVVSIDAYEWVMIPNVLGMGQFADGGMMMRRPYVSASAYLKRMSGNTLPKPPKTSDNKGWDTLWDALYYSFLMDHETRLGKVYAYSRSYAYIRKSSKEKQDNWKSIAGKFLK